MLQFSVYPCVFLFSFDFAPIPVARWFRFMIPGKGEGVSIYYYIFYSPYGHIPGVCFLFSFLR